MSFLSKRTYKFRLPQVLTLGLVLVALHFQAALAADYFGIGSAMELVFKGLLYGVFIFMSWLASFGSVAMETVLKPEFVSALFNMKALEVSWKIVRDFANIGFIFILLFSAFATIFQVAQYHIKKIFLSVLLAALFINLSFPIARFIIDTTTVPMYFFLNQIQGSASSTNKQGTVTGEFITSSGLREILFPKGEVASSQSITSKSTTYIITAIVFMFLFAVTILVLALQFFVRWVGLFILLIFSPIGFIGGVFPGLGSFSSKWWDKFISYCLFGPAAALILLIATKLMREFGEPGGTFVKQALQTANNVKGDEAPFFAAIIPFVFCLALLWMAIGVGSSFGIAGADAISSKGKSFAKGVGKRVWSSKANPFYQAYVAGKTWDKKRSDARTQAEQRSLGYRFGSKASYRQDQAIAGIAGAAKRVPIFGSIIGAGDTQNDAKGRLEAYNTTKVTETSKERDMSNALTTDLKKWAVDPDDKYLRAAARTELAGRQNLEGDEAKLALKETAADLGENSQIYRRMAEKVKAYDPATMIQSLRDVGLLKTDADVKQAISDFAKSNQADFKKFKKSTLNDNNFMREFIAGGGADRTQISSWTKDNNVRKAVVAELANSGRFVDSEDKTAKAIQEAYTNDSGVIAAMGEYRDATGALIEASANQAKWSVHMYKQVSKDFGGAIVAKMGIADEDAIRLFAENTSFAKYSEVVESNPELHKKLMRMSLGSKGSKLQANIAADPRLAKLAAGGRTPSPRGGGAEETEAGIEIPLSAGGGPRPRA